jgi:hypothetical protein
VSRSKTNQITQTMHMVIRAIVYAPKLEDAVEQAQKVFDRLVEVRAFDYYTTFNHDGSQFSGAGRWGKLPSASKADSKEGKKLIEEAMAYTKTEFCEAVAAIREFLAKYSADQLFDEGRFSNLSFRYECHRVGRHWGASDWLYDNNGSSIRSAEHLADALVAPEGMTAFVVPADVHF